MEIQKKSKYQNEGKGYFGIDNSQCETSSMISLDSNDLLGGISDFSVEKGSDSNYLHDGNAVKVTRTVNMFRNPQPQRATGEKRRAEM